MEISGTTSPTTSMNALRTRTFLLTCSVQFIMFITGSNVSHCASIKLSIKIRSKLIFDCYNIYKCYKMLPLKIHFVSWLLCYSIEQSADTSDSKDLGALFNNCCYKMDGTLPKWFKWDLCHTLHKRFDPCSAGCPIVTRIILKDLVQLVFLFQHWRHSATTLLTQKPDWSCCTNEILFVLIAWNSLGWNASTVQLFQIIGWWMP